MFNKMINKNNFQLVDSFLVLTKCHLFYKFYKVVIETLVFEHLGVIEKELRSGNHENCYKENVKVLSKSDNFHIVDALR